MPRIAFQLDQPPSAQTLALKSANYEEENQLSSDQASTTFAGQAVTLRDEPLDVLIKVPKSISQSYLIQKEFKSLVSLASEIAARTKTDVLYTPAVQLGTHTETGLPVLVGLDYKTRLIDKVREALETDNQLDADWLAIDSAITLSYAMESLHDMEQTAISRSMDDYCILDGRLIIVDWSSLRKLQDDNDKGIEIGNMFGQVWHEIFAGKKAQDFVTPLDDKAWQPLRQKQIIGGSLSLAMRYVLEVALHPNPQRRFASSARDLRIALDLIRDLFRKKNLDPKDFTPYMLGYDIHITTSEANAIGYDILWRRNGAQADDPLFVERQKAITEARKQPSRTELLEIKEDIIEGNYADAGDALNDLFTQAENSVTWGRLSRWQLLTGAFLESSDEVTEQLAKKAAPLVDIWSALDADEWKFDVVERLREQSTELEAILNGVDGDSTAFDNLALVLDEINLRIMLVEYRQERDNPLAQQNLLKIIRPQIAAIPYIQDRTPDDLGLVSQVIQPEAEERRLRALLQTRDVVEDSNKRLLDLLRAEQFYELHRVYEDTLLALEETDDAKLVADFVEANREYVLFADFKRLLEMESTSFTLNRKLEEAVRLSQMPKLLQAGVQEKPFEWLEHEIVQARNQLIVATRNRTYTIVSQPQTHLAYQAIFNYKDVFQNRYNYSGQSVDELLKEYETLNRFYNYYLHTVSGRNLYQRPFNRDQFIELFQKAREVNANMADLFADAATINEWREVLNLDEAEAQLVEYYDRLKEKLESQFSGSLEAFDEKIQAATQHVAAAKDKQYQTLYQMLVQTAMVQVAHEVSVALAAVQNFDATVATNAQQEAQKLVNGYRATLQRDDFAQLQNQLQTLKQPMDEIRQLAAIGKLPYYQRASELIRSGLLPDKAAPDTYQNIAEVLQENAKNSIVAVLQDRYWTLRVESAKRDIEATYLADEMEQRKREMATALRDLEVSFYNGEIKAAQQRLLGIQRLMGIRLADVLIYEIVRIWETRIANFVDCNSAIDNVQQMLQEAVRRVGNNPQNVIAELGATPDTILNILDLLVEKMRFCPADAFVPILFQRWLNAFQNVYDLYRAFHGRNAPALENSPFVSVLKEGERKAKFVIPRSTTTTA